MCRGSYAHRRLTPDEIKTVLRNHQAWLEAAGKPGDTRRANLCQATLQKATLQEANLQQADLFGATLHEATLQKATLREANLQEANLQGAILSGANLQRADLSRATLYEATLQGADLQEATLEGADLHKANLWGANLQETYLHKANLREVILWRATLQGANFQRADLSGADLFAANLQETYLQGANLQGAVYEPHPGTLPNFWTLTDPHNNLEKLVFHYSPAGLSALREALKKAGMHTQELQLTYAIEHTKQLHAWDPSRYVPKAGDTRPWLEKLAGKSESLFSYVLFELPSDYGMVPSRALATLGLLILMFALT